VNETTKQRCVCCNRFHEKELSAGNAYTRRTQHSTLDALEQRLALLRQQIDMERSVHASGSEHLAKATAELQEQTARWRARREDDLHSKDRDIDVSGVL
jgi:hypothetical protein